MLLKAFNTLGALALAIVLASGGFVGYLFISGRLNSARVETIAGVLRGQLDGAGSTPTSQPGGAGANAGKNGGASGEGAGATSAPAVCTQDELKAIRQRKHLEMLEADRALRDLEAQRRLLEQVMQQVVQEQEKLAAEKQTLTQQKQRTGQADRDPGFEKQVELVSGLGPKQAKEHLVLVWKKQPTDAVRLLMALSQATAKKTLEQFRTPEEIQIRTDLLEQVRLQGKDLSARTSGTTGGAAAP